MSRQDRITKYCCPKLFGALEEPRPGQMRISLKYFAPPNCEGSYYWRLTMAESKDEAGSLLVSNCPFCGKPIRVADSP